MKRLFSTYSLRRAAVIYGAVLFCFATCATVLATDTPVAVQVRVVDSDSAKVCGAVIALSDDYGEPRGPFITPDSSGKLSISAPPGTNTVSAYRYGYGHGTAAIDFEPNASNRPIVLTRASIDGDITSTSGAKIGGVSISLLRGDGNPSHEPNPKCTPYPADKPAITDAQGHYRLENVIGGTVKVKIEFPNAVTATPTVVIAGGATVSLPWSLQLPYIKGTVSDENGVPVPEASVRLSLVTLGAHDGEGYLHTADHDRAPHLKSSPNPTDASCMPRPSPTATARTVSTDKVGQYTIYDIDACVDYHIEVIKGSYNLARHPPHAEPIPPVNVPAIFQYGRPMDPPTKRPSQVVSPAIYRLEKLMPSQTFDHADMRIGPPVDVFFGEGAGHFAVHFINRTPRNVTVAFWTYDCHNVRECNSKNRSDMPADSQSMHSIVLGPYETDWSYTFDRAVPYQRDSDFSAPISYCYFSSDTFFNDENAFDVVAWASASLNRGFDKSLSSCRSIFSATDDSEL